MIKNAFIIALLALLFASCKNSPGKETDLHAGEEVKIQLTAYSPEFELFAEADPFVVGKSSNILSHFSHLPDFKALEKGSVTIRLQIGTTEVTQTFDAPKRKGIFSFDLKPTVQGVGKIIYEIKTENISSQVVVSDITVYSGEEQADEAAAKKVSSRTNTVVFTKEQSWKIDFSTEQPAVEPFGQVIKTSALVESAAGDEVIVSAKMNGIVLYSGGSILEGKSVIAGQGLFSVSGSDMADNNLAVRIIEAQNNYERTQLEYDRKKSLAKDKIVSDKDLLTAKNDFENAKATNDMLRKNFSSAGQTISSPISGFVKQTFVSNGQYVTAGQPLVSVTKNKTLLLRADIQQKYAPLLQSFSTAHIRTLHNNTTYTLEQLNGKLLSYGRNTNTDNYLIPVSLQIDNVGGFISGELVELYLKTITNSNAITIPNDALVEDQGNYFVFVQVNPELFEKREVNIGSTDGIKTEIKSGIVDSERIVTKGAILVKLAQSSGALDAHSGHVH
ncbi:MAG: efflux RND transporter periplasmic adaptor subunit [Bacteroidales bacterium]|jgi:RND family efflux transporter MFP subunit|nr:efflux RND transporter periplasmic adaptor subunit [Bacteroidales bacterium]MBK9358843.1 efflux RND transporter periplasmic adaptor subunit [Bacteroidales bacterium]MBP9883247.1 efflux RND transporter periplasmic adaptor subunit [Chitinophagales bacterium]